MFDIKTNYKI